MRFVGAHLADGLDFVPRVFSELEIIDVSAAAPYSGYSRAVVFHRPVLRPG